MKIKQLIRRSFTFILKLPIFFYKGVISPLIPHSCRFFPTCSTYFLQALEQFGLRGVGLGVKRIFRCNPFNKNHGYDPLPINIKGESKWLF